MACTLGRATLPSPNIIRQDGGRLRVGHTGYAFTAAEALAAALQLSGYPNPDEQQVPFTYDATLAGSILDGWYEFDGAPQVDWVKLATGMFAWEAALIPIKDFHAPQLTVFGIGDERDGGHAVTETNGWVAVPGSATGLSGFFGAAAASPLVSAALVGGGTVQHERVSNARDDSHPFKFSVPPASAYQGAPTLTVGGLTITGRQVLNDPDGWVLSNGLVKVRPSLTEINHFVVGVSDLAGTPAYSEVAYRIGHFNIEALELGYNGTTRVGPDSVVVLRNDRTCVSIRVTYPWRTENQMDGGGNATLTTPSAFNVDYTLRRGQTYVEVRVTTAGVSYKTGIWRAVTDTAASTTGGAEDNAAVSGVKWRIQVGDTRTADTTLGGAYYTNAPDYNSAVFAVGNDRTFFASTTLSQQFYAVQEHTEEVGVR